MHQTPFQALTAKMINKASMVPALCGTLHLDRSKTGSLKTAFQPQMRLARPTQFLAFLKKRANV